MSKYNGTEGRIISDQEFQEWTKAYESIHGKDEDFTRFEVIGKDNLAKLVSEEAVAARIYNGWREGQTCVIVVPVNKEGKELPVIFTLGGLKDGPEGGKGSGGGVRCPTSC